MDRGIVGWRDGGMEEIDGRNGWMEEWMDVRKKVWTKD